MQMDVSNPQKFLENVNPVKLRRLDDRMMGATPPAGVSPHPTGVGTSTIGIPPSGGDGSNPSQVVPHPIENVLIFLISRTTLSTPILLSLPFIRLRQGLQRLQLLLLVLIHRSPLLRPRSAGQINALFKETLPLTRKARNQERTHHLPTRVLRLHLPLLPPLRHLEA